MLGAKLQRVADSNDEGGWMVTLPGIDFEAAAACRDCSVQGQTAEVLGQADAAVELRPRARFVSSLSERYQDPDLTIEEQPLGKIDMAVQFAVDGPAGGAKIIGRHGNSAADVPAGKAGIDFGIISSRREPRIMREAGVDDAYVCRKA